MKSPIRFIIVVMVVLSTAIFARAQDTETLRVLTHDSFNVSEDVLTAFEEETGITVEILRAGDAGQVVNQSILAAGNPLGDVLYGVDNTFLSRALENDLFIPYQSPLLENVDESFIFDDAYSVTPIDYGDVCLNYDIGYFEENELALPDSLEALTDEAYQGLLVVENPATSSPGLAFLLATINQFGTEGDYTYLDYWTDLVENDVLITDGWSDAYYTYFTAASEDGTYPLVVSYASSPPVTYDEDLEAATTASIVADGTCFRQIEYAGILNGTEKEEVAQQFIDFLLSVDFQEDLTLQMYVFPVNEEAELPELFADYAQIPENPVLLDVVDIEENREAWIEAWTETVLR
ncbi:thiamine ABC transporter substrate-binding protein [Phototrophicus methaneseepsis]|nr:thiamine ABC transporter substrate-binding protein [Phototrophicus methaneseepsis]